MPSAGAEPGGVFALRVNVDARDASAGSPDLRQVAFAQRRTQVWLKLRLQEPWSPREELCVDAASTAVCVARSGGRTVLRRDRTVLHARVSRPDPRTLVARVDAIELGLRGSVRWSVRSSGDRAPDTGTFRTRLGAYVAPRCFGAAARGCTNPALRRSATPRPSDALLTPDAPCRPVERGAYPAGKPCRFGDPAGSVEVALIGDSHAAHWRAAVGIAARAAGLGAVSMTESGCALTTQDATAGCPRRNAEALAWLRAHPAVHTLITSAAAGRGLRSAGFTEMWRDIPASVRRVLVLRDVPRTSFRTGDCVSALLRARRSLVGRCGVTRAFALPADTAATAAASAGPRFRVVDHTRFFCGRSRCQPVIGGAFVYRDAAHMNSVFSETLGAYLPDLRAPKEPRSASSARR